MHVEWTSYSSPIGALTVVECEAGPLVVEFPHRATTIKWAVRLRSAVPELHIGQGPCRTTTTWLDEYFAGSARPFPYPDHLKRWFDTIAERPAVQRGVKVLAELRKPVTDDKAREVLFGATQYQRR